MKSVHLTYYYFSLIVWLRWLDAQHSHLPATSSADHKGDDEWSHNAADSPWRQHNRSGDVHHVAAQQAVIRLCKCLEIQKNNSKQNECLVHLSAALVVFLKQFYFSLKLRQMSGNKRSITLWCHVMSFVRSVSATTQRSISVKKFPSRWLTSSRESSKF